MGQGSAGPLDPPNSGPARAAAARTVPRVRVQLEGPPAKDSVGVIERGSALEPRLAEVAPRADDVRVDLISTGASNVREKRSHLGLRPYAQFGGNDQIKCSGNSVAENSLSGTSLRVPKARWRSSTIPSDRRRPTTTMFGTPISSASVRLHSGRNARSVVDDTSRPPGQLGRPAAGPPQSGLPSPPPRVHVGWGDRGRPGQSLVVVVLLGDSGDQARHADAIRTHGDPDRPTVRTQGVKPKRIGEPAAKLKDVADLHAATHGQFALAT